MHNKAFVTDQSEVVHVPIQGVQRRMVLVVNFFVLFKLLFFFALLLIYAT